MDNDTTPATTPHWMAPRSHSHLLSAFLVTLNILLIILLFLYLYKFFWQKQSDPNSQSNPYDDTNSTFSSPPTSPRNGRGHELQFINSLPVIEFKNTSLEKVECAVCLSEFKDGEKARVLPKCDHQFHVECVDRWFKSNANCPLCRTPVESNDHAALDTVV